MSEPRPLDRLLRPRSVAVFGGAIAAEVVRQLVKIGFAGQIWPVHTRHETVEGLKAYRSVAELPGAPDAAFIAVNRRLSVDIVGDLAARGAGGAICYASGFAESGEDGGDLQAALLAAAGDMPFLGPNCYGLINYLDRVALWPDQHGAAPVARGVAIITQSGNIGLDLTMHRRALPLSHLVTLGNQAKVGLSAMISALVEDERVTAIGLHIEGIDDPDAFAQACAKAHARKIPVVALKTGRSSVGAQLTVSHTASLAGADAVVDAFFQRVGVVRVGSIPVLLETLKVLHLHGPLPGRRIASLSCSGGEAALMADTAEQYGLRFEPFTADQEAAIAETLTELVTISNPFDYHTFAWGDEPALTGIFAATLRAENDETLLVLDFPRADRCDAAAWDVSMRAMIAAAQATGRRACIVSSLAETMPEDRALLIAQAGLAPLMGIDDALAALSAAATAGEIAARSLDPQLLPRRLADGPAQSLSEWDGKQLLARFGLSTPEGRMVADAQAAGEAAEALGYPLALKAVGASIAHKTEMGAVKLNLTSRQAVEAAAAPLAGLGEGLLVEQMVTDGVAELIIGVNRDPVFGLYLVIGAGGQLVELIQDSRILLMPTRREAVIEAVLSLKSAKLLQGFRGRPLADLEAVADAVLAIEAFVASEGDTLLELDINPLIVRPQGRGAVAADVLIRLAHSPIAKPVSDLAASALAT